MSTIDQPSVCETVYPSLFGVRDWLANSGWGIQGTISPVIDRDIKNKNDGGTQKYAGHNGASGYIIGNVYATYDLSRIGFPAGGQFTGSVSTMYSHNRAGEAPVMHPAVTTLGITQPLLDNTVELKAGYLLTIQDFVGMNLTGNAGSVAQSLSSVIPSLAGLSVYTPTPTAEITVKDPWTKSFYNRFGISRSISSSGATEELAQNRYGLRWRTPGTSALFVNEFGYKTGLSQEGRSVWARAGLIYNTTDYTKYDGQTASNNYAAYAGLTMQLTKSAHGPGGLNLDVKVNYAPADRNMYTRDYSVALFYIGPFASRPFDMVSLAYSQTFGSRDLQKMVTKLGVQNSVTLSTAGMLSYSYRLTNGVYLVSTASVVTNPGTVWNSKLPTAVILDQKLLISF
ncbi:MULTISPECIES: carbohydrate porin [Variovorax]|uniref:carbohydrate porin n=1 Tax=Variovorax TaxID=34072 RepID=UPI0021AC6BB2|nr:carbohydrate porin [Variovorax paradoxus]UVH57757.1 carbohydrate porin [Variovorax paradoxus]